MISLLRKLDHVDGRRVAALFARPAFQRGLELPDRRVPRSANGIERQAGPGLAAIAFHLKPAESVNRRGVPTPIGALSY